MLETLAQPNEDFLSKSLLSPTQAKEEQPFRSRNLASEEPLTIDELVRNRASLGASQPVVSYPRVGTEYVDYPIRQLDVFAFRVAKKLVSTLPQRASSSESPRVVGLLGPSRLDYLVTMFALSKLGHSVLFLSTRISVEAYTSLLERTHSTHVLFHASFKGVTEELQRRVPGLTASEIPGSDVYGKSIPAESTADFDTNMTAHLDPRKETAQIAWIIHSSGSTGLPKPIFQTHKAAIKNYAGNMNMSGFVTLPLYHNHGICCMFRSIFACKRIYLYNAELPLTKKYLLDIMNNHDFEIFYGVPYALKLLTESDDGAKALTKFKIVMFGGSACPDSLGDKLVARNVNLVSHYGSTETGQLMTSFRPAGDKEWNWLRPSDFVRQYLKFEERSPGIFELIVLDGYPSKVTSNRPDGSYATKDLFMKHPSMEAYKYFARLDDTIVLVNGEKVNPLGLEGLVRQHEAVAEAVVFGAGKSSIGLAAIRSKASGNLSDDEIIESIWQAVEKAHEAMPAYGRLAKSMVRILPADTVYPSTDKGTIIRQAFYRDFKDLIERTYDPEDTAVGTLKLPELELKKFIRKHLLEVLSLGDDGEVTDDSDFFGLGMNSLQATHLRSILNRQIYTNGHKLGLNVAFEYPTINSLTRHILSLASGTAGETDSVENLMESLIAKYGKFERHFPVQNDLQGRFILVTGVTGSLGSHVAARLCAVDEVKKVYCLVRARSAAEAHKRIMASMRKRRVDRTIAATSKLFALPSDLSHPALGMEAEIYNVLASEITDVIHCAWPVNFNMHLSSFEKDGISGIVNLLSLCLKARRPAPASFNFCSSVSAVVHTVGDEIPECLPAKLSYAQNMGYAQSKLVGEHICINAARQTGVTSRVLRIGQIIGDTKYGIWNPTEAIPLMLQCAKTIGALPKLEESPLWLPVDNVAAVVIEISLSDPSSPTTDTSANTQESENIFNIVSPHSFHWTRDLIPYLRHAGLEFDELDQREWLQRLKSSNPDPAVNPPIKLVEFFAGKYDTTEPRKAFVWRTEKARERSPALAHAKPLSQELVSKMVQYFRKSWGRTNEAK